MVDHSTTTAHVVPGGERDDVTAGTTPTPLRSSFRVRSSMMGLIMPDMTSLLSATSETFPRSPPAGHDPRHMAYARRRSSSFMDASGTMERLKTTLSGGIDKEDTGAATPQRSRTHNSEFIHRLQNGLGQIPAILLIAMFHLMIGIPFGVSYFPVSWVGSEGAIDVSSDSGNVTSTTLVLDTNGDLTASRFFPLPGKEALGIRMFLFSTIVGQIVFTLTSQFPNPIGLQMVENVPFCHELAAIVFSHQGYGLDALSTLIVMFGLASILVGTVFYLLGRFQLGRVVYFFPTHVLVGCIGGIGIFITKTAVEVTIADAFGLQSLQEHADLIGVVLAFEVGIRVLEQVAKGRYPLLSPIYFCLITPIFYLVLIILGVPTSVAEDAGYFFPRLDDSADVDDSAMEGSSSSSFVSQIFADPYLFDMWKVINLPQISWHAIWDAIPTLIALSLFSLIHVPINIPAFALSTNTEVDMNNELISHGYANLIAGLVGGLQNYMAYTQSVLYDKSGGTGRPSGFAVAAVTALLFFIGPTIASYIPRCMAGTLLVHIGIDLFLEGVYDSYDKFDRLEYFGIWMIVLVMATYGMEGAMIAGIIAAVSTYAVQSITYLNPIRGFMPGSTLRSCGSKNHCTQADAILESPTLGRHRILVIQLQGHLFFGNMAQFTESMDLLLSNDEEEAINAPMATVDENQALVKSEDQTWLSPLVVILDFSLVLSIDSSAAQAISKLKNAMLTRYNCEFCIFVTGSDDGFPTEFRLSEELSKSPTAKAGAPNGATDTEAPNEDTALLMKSVAADWESKVKAEYLGSRVCSSLDVAVYLAEKALVARKDPTLLDLDDYDYAFRNNCRHVSPLTPTSSPEDERLVAQRFFENLCPVGIEPGHFELLYSFLEREVYKKGDLIWMQDSLSDCAKLLVSGTLMAQLENEAGTTEEVNRGNFIGELGLVQGYRRMSSVHCISDEAIAYSLNRTSYEELVRTSPTVARYIDLICIKYLANRVQHVSNRIFETRCLPI
jgi:sulfate permease, SulP family